MPALKDFPTVNVASDTLVIVTIGNEEQSWRLDPGAAISDPSQLSPADYNVVSNNKHWQLVSSVATGGGGGGGGDITPLVMGQSYVTVVFSVVQPNPNWEFTELQVVNTVDANPLNIWPGILTSKSTTGFTLQLNGMPDSGNYHLHWSFTGSGSGSGPAATTYVFSGPTTGAVGVPKTYTVALPTGTTVSAPVTVTLSDIGGGGTFSPTSVTLTTAAPSSTFTYTPASVGIKTLSVTNDGGLTDPSSIAFNSTAFSTAYSLTGPSGSLINVASANFTVALPVGGTLASPVVVTPSDGGAGGTFSPTSVTISTGSPSATFTYTPTTYGPRAIATTNGGGLTDPAAIGFTSEVSTYNLSGPSSGIVSTPSTNFTVALPAGGYIVGTVSITPHETGTGVAGAFTPSTVALTNASPSATFTYTPASTGGKTISTTNSRGLTDPASLTYTAASAFGTGTVAGLQLWLKGESLPATASTAISTWPDSSGHGRNATQSGTARPVTGTATFPGTTIYPAQFTAASLQYMSFASLGVGGTNWTVFAVLYSPSGSQILGAGTSVANDAPYLAIGGAGVIGIACPAAGGAYGNSAAATFNGAWHVVMGQSTSAIAVDGVAQTFNYGGPIAVADFNTLGYSAPSSYSDGFIAETLIYDSVLGGTDITTVTSYLKTKYGIP